MIGHFGSAPHEFSNGPLTGYKLAHPMLSSDGRRAGFCGVGAGRNHIYLAVDTAACMNNSRHASPSRLCQCGFYCYNTLKAARDLTCAPNYHDTVILEVAAHGRYLRHELGLRYESQRVRKVYVGRCRCGRLAEAFIESGTGRTGWRQLTANCLGCADARPILSLTTFGTLTGEDVAVSVDREPVSPFTAPEARGALPQDGSAPVIDAELALINARIDELQNQLNRLLHRNES